jgi:hypothetical protein
MSLRETDVLFEHTRHLRAGHSDRVPIEAEGKHRHGKKDYAFVRKPSESESNARRGARSLDREESVTLRDMMSFK